MRLRYDQFMRDPAIQNDASLQQVRHEIFFIISKKNGIIPAPVRASLALIRDIFHFLFKHEPVRPNSPDVLVIATLPGPSGLETVRRALPHIRKAGLSFAIVPHLRLDPAVIGDLPVVRLPRPRASAVAAALAVGLRQLGRAGTSDRWTKAVTTARGALWRAAWAAMLAGRSGILIMHNDFDMMSAASIGHGWKTICLQHGMPSEEFFPARADHHVVWGQSSQTAYRDAGVSAARLVIDSMGRGEFQPFLRESPRPPRGIVLISQSHAVIFGPGTRDEFHRAAQALLHRHPDLRILLHPNEVANHPYADFPEQAIETPPHQVLSCPDDVYLVVGHASTALIDAARCGHYVLRLAMNLMGGNSAIIRPPMTAETPDEAAEVFLRLRNDAELRNQYRAATELWLERTFAQDQGNFALLIERLTR